METRDATEYTVRRACDAPGSRRDVSDAIGEIANMVLGAVKSRIQESVGAIEVSIPCVVCGHGLVNSLGEGADEVRVPVRLDEEHIAEFSLWYRDGRP